MISIKQIILEDNLDWNGLIKDGSTATFFQTKEWLKLWVKHWGKSGEVVIYAIYDNDQLVGIAPFHKTSGKIELLGVPDPSGNASLSDFGDIIIKTGREKEVWEAVLLHMRNNINVILGTPIKSEDSRIDSGPASPAGRQARMTIGLELNYVREESPSFKILQELGGKAEELEVSPVIDLPKSWDEYLSTLDRHNRHEIRRKLRKTEEEEVIKVCDEINTPNIEDFYRLMISSNVKKGDFLSEDMRKFFSEVILELGQKKLLTLCFLQYKNINIAAILLLYQRNEVLLYNSGFDPKHSFLSPGLILNVYAIKRAIEEGKDRFDFLRGGEKYKYDLGGIKRNLYKISF